ncbi:MAG: hypothetical protein PHY45_07410 [Rhodocyclaceae bacterium]|nr:hypothetical protein [Rhodocyclaceae bacterium]
MAVRTQAPWYLRTLGFAVGGAVALALAGWVFDAGRRIAGFDRSETAQEIGSLSDKVAELEAEVAKLRAANNASESNLQIERTAQQQLTSQVQMLEAENSRLKEENAVFGRLAQDGSKDSKVTISRLRVFADGNGGRYRYQFFVAQNADQRGREFKGNVQVVAAVPNESAGGMMIFPRPNDPDAGRFVVAFKHFSSIDGAFTLPSGVKPKSVEVRLMQDGAICAAQTVNL